MKTKFVTVVLFVCCFKIYTNALSFPGPRVYVVTPSVRPQQNDDGKFYYHKWMRRMDTGPNSTTTTTSTTKPRVKTPDLIFAEFESDGSMQKSIRKLLEKEKVTSKPATMDPIYVQDEEESKVTRVVNYGLPIKIENDAEVNTEPSPVNKDYSFMFNNNNYNNVPAPVYISSTKPPTTKIVTTSTTTTEKAPIGIENIWHIIDNEKFNEYTGNWQEETDDTNSQNIKEVEKPLSDGNDSHSLEEPTDVTMDENFALPGFATNPGSGAENESRAIRTEPVVRFPYINLKPFQIKPSKNPSFNSVSNSKKHNNLLTSLDHFTDLKHPVRGEVQDILPTRPTIDRYNAAQPYLPQQNYGNKVSKQSSHLAPVSSPTKATAMLVPPPPPYKVTGDDFPVPVSYESFPPYAPTASDSGPAVVSDSAPPPSPPPPPPAPAPAPAPIPAPPQQYPPSIATSLETPDSSDNSDDTQLDFGYRYKPPMSPGESDDSPFMGMGYYKPPSPPAPQYYPTPQPAPKPFAGYSYNKPSMDSDSSSIVDDKPEFHGYHYKKPDPKPPTDYMPHSYDSPPSYGHDASSHPDAPPYGHDSDYHDLIFDKPHDDPSSSGMNDMKGDDMGMMAPPPPDTKPDTNSQPPDDHGFPSDFPSDFKYHHDFDDHDHDHYHYHHPTTTTTTEMPRVNRFSYYYLGKKLYYLPLYFSVYFIVYVGALIIKAVLRHKIVYPNSWRPNTTTATFFSKRSVDEYLSNDNLHEVTRRVTHALATAAEKYMNRKK